MSVKHQHRLAEAFLGWQCRIRQHAIRRQQGRPSQGMRPVMSLDGTIVPGAITTVLNKKEPADSITEFQYVVKKNNDPRLRFEAALGKLQVNYFKNPRSFSDKLTATFSPGSEVASALLGANNCRLSFDQSNQRFSARVTVRELAQEEPLYLATFWHNAMFNPRLNFEYKVLEFAPDWTDASSDPTPFP